VASTVTALVTEQKSADHRVALLRLVLNGSAVSTVGVTALVAAR
jgi:hypothetical protein